jgi:hypothetical protein
VADASRRRLLGWDPDAGDTAAVRQHLPALPLRLQPGRFAPDAQAFRQLGVDEHYRGGRGRLAGFLRVHGRPPWLGWAAAS